MRLLAKPALKPIYKSVKLFIAYYDIPARYTFRLFTPFEYTTESQTKTELLKLHNGLWCRVCAPYEYVPFSHLGNIVLTNEIATFHNGGTSSSKCATLIISVFFLLQKKMKNVLSIPNNSAFIFYSICSREETTFTS